MTTSYLQLIKDLQKKIFTNVYLLYGEEPYFIDEISDWLTENVLDETEKEFNLMVAYGRDTATASIVNAAKQFPMVGTRQLVVLREAQDMDLKKEDNLNLLLAYLRQPQPGTMLVICHKYKTPPAKLLKAITASGVAVAMESKRKWESELPAWIIAQVKANGYSISEKAASMMVEYLGNDLEKINNELGKLYINIPRAQTISEDNVADNIGISKEYNIFEFIKALATRNVAKANQITHHFAINPGENSIFRLIPMLYSFFTKVLVLQTISGESESAMASRAKITYSKQEHFIAARNYNPAKIQAIIGWLRECNARSIGIDNATTDQGELLRELVFKILH
jgi:DNA polymerase III subunit delta